MSKKESQPTRGPDPKQARYSDGSPLDEVQYLECKIILKPDRFTSRHCFADYGALVKHAADEFGIGFSTKGVAGQKPRFREVLFLDTPDFRLYNNAFILRRRIPYEDGFPPARPRSSSSFVIQTCKSPPNGIYDRTSQASTGSNSRQKHCHCATRSAASECCSPTMSSAV